ncbi:MAG: pyridoxamine 5-phosphate oxidase, partial [Pseudomonadota bacterium]|nr:pyridoxamine 5-phosphate oxidase [Pseudomonadota bacterium]
MEKNPINPTDDDARGLARDLIGAARFGALGVIDPATGIPMVSRVAVVPDQEGMPMSLVSDL